MNKIFSIGSGFACLALAFGAGMTSVKLAQAQDLVFSMAATEQCLGAHSETPDLQRGCIGVSANLCQDKTPGGYSTPVIAGCLSLEADYWDQKLNQNYRWALAQARAMDKDMPSPVGQSVEEGLKAAQRAWIPFRDATCAFETAQWGGGTGASGAWVACVMRMSGEQALFLATAVSN